MARPRKGEGEEGRGKVEIEESEKDGREGGLKGKRRKNHDAIIFVPARERILSSSSRAG